jgi:hypothetical protein
MMVFQLSSCSFHSPVHRTVDPINNSVVLRTVQYDLQELMSSPRALGEPDGTAATELTRLQEKTMLNGAS